MRYTRWAVVLATGVALSGSLLAQAPYSGYATAQHTNVAGYYISGVELTTSSSFYNLTNYSFSAPYTCYSDFTSGEAGCIRPGNWTHCTVSFGPYAQSGGSMAASLWIDYNNDGDFLDAGELVAFSNFSSSANHLSFTPPAGLAGPRRMRIRATSAAAPMDSTATYPNGETEDYIVNFGLGVVMDHRRRYAQVGWPFSLDVTGVDGVFPYTWSSAPSYIVAGQLPPGLTITWQPPWASNGAYLEISGTPTTKGRFEFDVELTDGSVPPATVRNHFALTIFESVMHSLPYEDDFSIDRGWLYGASWSRAPATGFSATGPIRSEPGVDHSPSGDNMILGDSIGGLYAHDTMLPDFAVSPILNTGSASAVRLRFARWAGTTDDYNADQLRLEVGSLGSQYWRRIWSSPASVAIFDNGWTIQEYDISAYTSGGSFQLRFSVGPIGPSQSTGWCIDDLVVEAFNPLQVREGGALGSLISDNQPVGGLRDMGKWLVGQSSSDLDIYLFNDGASDINFGAFPGSFAVSGSNPTEFAVVPLGTFLSPLPPGQATHFAIRFLPGSLGFKSATISVPHDAVYSGIAPFEVNVSAWAVQQSISVVTQPLGGAAGVILTSQPVVAVLDSGGAIDITDNTSVITATLGGATPGAVLYGTTSVTVVAGVASFNDLYVDRGGSGYVLTLTHSNGGLGSLVSSSFDVAGFVSGNSGGALAGKSTPDAGCSTSIGNAELLWLVLVASLAVFAWRQQHDGREKS